MYRFLATGYLLRYGKLTVLSYSKKGAYKTAICRCDCGNIKEIYLTNLKGNRTKSCGCLEEKNRRRFNDISGKRYGCIEVIAATNRRDKSRYIIWKCLCDCGTIFYCSGKYLIHRGKTHCGCQRKNKVDITNKRFGKLIALRPIQKNSISRCKWICECDCRQWCLVRYGNLISGHTKSCSCLKKQDFREKIDGTFVESLIAKRSKNNKSGVKGVCQLNNKWISYINLAGKRYHLGTYKKLEDAKTARKQAETELFFPIIEKAYKQNVKRTST